MSAHLTTPQDIVLRALAKLTRNEGQMPVTGPELSDYTGNFTESATPRLNQLAKKGLAEKTGGSAASGAACWRVTPAGLELLRSRP